MKDVDIQMYDWSQDHTSKNLLDFIISVKKFTNPIYNRNPLKYQLSYYIVRRIRIRYDTLSPMGIYYGSQGRPYLSVFPSSV